jgi:HEAT repeat protein
VTRTAWVVVGSVIAVGGLTPCTRALCPLPVASVFIPSVFASTGASIGSAQQQPGRPFEDVAAELASPDPKVRVSAMRTLNKAGHPDAIQYIARLLTDPKDDIQLEALDTLLGFYLPEVPPKSKRVAYVIEVEGGSRAARAFEQGPFILLPRPSPPELKKGLAGAMRDDNAEIRLEATYALGAMVPPPAGPEAEASLAENLRDRDPAIRLAAARVAGAVRASTITDAIVAAINDPDEKIKLAALRAVGDIKDPRGVKALEEQFNYYKKGELARAALDGLARIGQPSSLSLFQEHLTDRDPALRRFAIEGVVRTHDKAAIDALEISTAGESDNSAQLARAFATETAGKRGLDLLVSRLSDDLLFEQSMGYIVELGPRVIAPLAEHLKDPNPRVRERIAQTLGLIGDNTAAPALEGTLRDPDINVARAAERALARIRIIAATRSQQKTG